MVQNLVVGAVMIMMDGVLTVRQVPSRSHRKNVVVDQRDIRIIYYTGIWRGWWIGTLVSAVIWTMVGMALI